MAHPAESGREAPIEVRLHPDIGRDLPAALRLIATAPAGGLSRLPHEPGLARAALLDCLSSPSVWSCFVSLGEPGRTRSMVGLCVLRWVGAAPVLVQYCFAPEIAGWGLERALYENLARPRPMLGAEPALAGLLGTGGARHFVFAGERAPTVTAGRVPRTLLFCTAYADHRHGWNVRTRRWSDYLLRSSLEFSQLLIVDDASPVLPPWSLALSRDEVWPDAEAPFALHQFTSHRGKPARAQFPGWHRSFCFAGRYARAHGFARIVHIEADAFPLSPRAFAFLNEWRDGWAALWCPVHQFPELAIQAVAGAGLDRFYAFCDQPYEHLAGRVHELAIGFTHVETGLVGDRYGEIGDDIPREADYVCQARPGAPPEVLWWLR